MNEFNWLLRRAAKIALLSCAASGLWGCEVFDDDDDDSSSSSSSSSSSTSSASSSSGTGQPGFTTAAIFEAEGGGIATLAAQGSDMAAVIDATDPSITYITAQVNATTPPEDSNRVVSLDVEFPQAGTWVVYGRVRVGPQGSNDDSFYVDTDLGEGTQWQLFNGISGVIAPGQPGYDPEDSTYISVGASSATETWLWFRLSELEFTVEEGNLTGTFQYAGREDGLEFDKFAIASPDLNFTAAQIEQGLAGDELDPPYEPSPYTPPADQQPMAAGRDKFVGGICCGNQIVNFTAYFNQVTPENAGKWASVEATRDEFVWDELDEAVQLAEDNGYLFRYHVLVWGSQQPDWIAQLPVDEQRAEIEEWFEAVANRYGERIDYLEVVNEFISAPPCTDDPGRGGYIEALGTACVEQTVNGAARMVPEDNEWILESFRLADQYFPATVQLMLNEYSVINEDAKASQYVEVVEQLQAEDLIDAIGFQGHAFSTRGGTAQMTANLDRLGATGLPLMATELDIDSPQFANGDDDEVAQMADYQRIFPTVYEHPDVIGVTLWGYRPGLWREAQGAMLAYEEGEEKLALQWLNGYVRQNAPAVTAPASPVSVALAVDIGTEVADFDAPLTLAGDPLDAAEVTWVIAGGNEAGLFEFDQGDGTLNLAATPVAGTYDLRLYAGHGQVVSNLIELQVVIE